MDIYRTNEKTPRKLVLLNPNHDEETTTYVDVTNLKFMHVLQTDWINTIHELDSEYVDGLFSLKLTWGMNDMSNNDSGRQIRGQMNEILGENGIGNLQYNEESNFDISPEIDANQIEKVLQSDRLGRIIEAMRAYNLELVVC